MKTSICKHICFWSAATIVALLWSSPNRANAADQTQLTINTPAALRVYQRGSDNQATVAISGSLTAEDPTLIIEARTILENSMVGTPVDWTVIDSQLTGTSYDGTLSVPAGGWYQLQVRAKSNGTVMAETSVNRFGVGEVFIAAGQSNAGCFGESPQPASDVRVSAYDGGSWRSGDDPQTCLCSPWPVFCSKLAERLQMPVAYAGTAVGGSGLSAWLPGTDYYNRLVGVAINLGGVRAVLWHQGETDAMWHTPILNYYNGLSSIVHQSSVDVGYALPWMTARATYIDGFDDYGRALVLEAQSLLWSNGISLQGPDTDDLTGPVWRYDGAHLTGLGLRVHAGRWFDQVWAYFFAENPVQVPNTLPFVEISGVQVTNVTSNSATVTWNTNVPCGSTLDWGSTSSYEGTPVPEQTVTTNHSVTLSGLASSTIYNYRICLSPPSGYACWRYTGSLTTTAALGASWALVDDFSNAGNWTLDTKRSTGSGSITTDGDVATLQADFQGKDAFVVWKRNLPLGIDLHAFPKLQSRVRKPADMAPYHVFFQFGILPVSASQEVDSQWRVLGTSWTNPWPLVANVSAGTIFGTAYIMMRSTDVPAGMPTKVEIDSWSMSKSTEPTYPDDPGTDITVAANMTNLTYDGATITWHTNVPCDSTLNWGPTQSYGRPPVSGGTNTQDHSVTLTGLAPSTTYYYHISTSAQGHASAEYKGALATHAAPGVKSVHVDNYSDVSDWTVAYGGEFNPRISTDGNTATLEADFQGRDGYVEWVKSPLGIRWLDLPKQQIRVRKPAALAPYHVYLWLGQGDILGTDYYNYIKWVEIGTDWTNPWPMTWSGGNYVFGRARILMMSTGVPAGTTTRLEIDYWLCSKESEPNYSDDPLPSQIGLASAKWAPDGAAVDIIDAFVTAIFRDFFYVESGDRSSGIRVYLPGHDLSVGSKVHVEGVLSTNSDGERCILASRAVSTVAVGTRVASWPPAQKPNLSLPPISENTIQLPDMS